jgi:hypothetical protein
MNAGLVAKLLVKADASEVTQAAAQARAALAGLETATDKVAAANDDAAGAGRRAADAAQAHAAAARQAADAVDDHANKAASATKAHAGLGGVLGVVGGTVGMLAAGAAVGAAGLLSLALAAVQTGVDLDKAATTIGVGVEALQELRFAAVEAGVGVETMDGMLTRLGESSRAADDDASLAAIAFERVGTSARDASGKTRPLDDVLGDVLTGLAAIPDDAERAVAAQELLGVTGADLADVLAMTSDGMDAARQKARELGVVMSEEAVAAAMQARENFERLGHVVGQQMTAAASAALPLIVDLTGAIAEQAPRIIGLAQSVLEWLGVLDQTPIRMARAHTQGVERMIRNAERARSQWRDLPLIGGMADKGLIPGIPSKDEFETELNRLKLQAGRGYAEISRLETQARDRADRAEREAAAAEEARRKAAAADAEEARRRALAGSGRGASSPPPSRAPAQTRAADLAAAREALRLEERRAAAVAETEDRIAQSVEATRARADATGVIARHAEREREIQALLAPMLKDGLAFSQAQLAAKRAEAEAAVDLAAAETAAGEERAARDAAARDAAAARQRAIEAEVDATMDAALARTESARTLLDLAAEEARFAGLTREEREALTLVESEINRLRSAGVQLSAADLEAHRAQLALLAKGVVEARKANRVAEMMTRRMEEAARDVEDAWVDAWDRMLDGSLDGFADFGQALVKQWKTQVLTALMKRIVVQVDLATSGGQGGFGLSGEGGLKGLLNTLSGGLDGVLSAFEAEAGKVGESFQSVARSFGAKAGGTLDKLAGSAGQAFAGGTAGVEVAKALGLKGSEKATWQAVGDVSAAVIGYSMGGPIGAAIATIISRGIGTLTRDKDYPYARADIVVANGAFSVKGTEGLDGGPADDVAAGAAELAKALNEAAKLFKIDLSQESGAYASWGWTSGRFALDKGFFGGAVNTAAGEYDQTSDALGTGRKGAANLEAVSTAYGTAVEGMEDAGKAALEVIKDTMIRLAERAGEAFTDAEIAVIRSAESIEEAAARISRGRDFARSIEDMILEIVDPALAARNAAIRDVEEKMDALKAEARGLIEAGLVSSDTLARIDRLRELQLDKTLADLGSAAAGAMGAIQAAAPRLREWLDRAAMSEDALIAPAEARALAYAQYERLLEKAKAGDSEALGRLTGAADALLDADRAATEDAQARRALFESVTGAIAALAATDVEASTPALLQELTRVTDDGLSAVVAAIAKATPPVPTGQAPAPGPGARTRAIVEGDGGGAQALTRAVAAAADHQVSSLAPLLAAMADRLASVEGAIAEQAREQRVANAWARQARAAR